MQFRLLLFFILFVTKNFAQTPLKIGQWQQHLPFQKAKYVAQSDKSIFLASDYGIVIVDKTTNERSFLSKVEGLSNSNIEFIKYNRSADALFVVYKNGEFDLIKAEKIINVKDISNNNNISGFKTIYDISFSDNKEAFFACSFGVLKFDIQKEEFAFTTFTNSPILSVAVLDNFIYAASEKGIFRVENSTKINLADFSKWELLNEKNGFPTSYAVKKIIPFNKSLYFSLNDSLFVFQNKPQKIFYEKDFAIKFLSNEGKNLLVGLDCKTCPDKMLSINTSNQISIINSSCFSGLLYGIEDEKGQIWLADSDLQFRKLLDDKGTCQKFEINSPLTNTVSDIAIDDNKVWIAYGGVTAGRNAAQRYEGFASLIEGKWETFNRGTKKELPFDLLDYYQVAINPSNKKVYVGTYWGGVVEYDGKNYTFYNKNNSSLLGAIGDPLRERISGMIFDKNDNLWIANSTTSRPISVLTKAGKWKNFGNTLSLGLGLSDIIIDNYNNKWVVVSSNEGGLLVFNEGKDVENENDDLYKRVTINNSLLPDNAVNCAALDLDGAVWVGTAKGILVFECNVLNEQNRVCKGTEIKVTLPDGNTDRLLAYEDVKVIAVDGANRKWFGTTNGLFVQSADGKEQIAYYNINNSPLLDNTITALAFDEEKGVAYIGTQNGLQSLRIEATKGATYQPKSVTIFPNPVRPNYDGVIAIKGLTANSNVKIADISGQLVYETRANGGQAIWDGKSFDGQKVSTGVYLVLATNDDLDNPATVVGKILFVR